MDVAGGSVEATTAAAIEVTPIPAARNFDLGLHNLDERILRLAVSAACGSSRIAPFTTRRTLAVRFVPLLRDRAK
jgi:hypothetical protein